MEQDREISREELRQLVWSKPTRIAAKEFGLSNVGRDVRRNRSGRLRSRLREEDETNRQEGTVPKRLLPIKQSLYDYFDGY